MTDAAVLEAACRVIARRGPADFTLGAVAEEAGLAPATLIVRFGSKHGLRVALARAAAEGAGDCFARARARRRSPLKALFSLFDEMARMAATPEALANALAFLQTDLADPVLRHWTVEHSRATLAGYRALLDDAIRAGELRQCDAAGLARLIRAAAHGSLVAWAFDRRGQARSRLRRDMELLLRPYRTGAAAPRGRVTAGAGSPRLRRRDRARG